MVKARLSNNKNIISLSTLSLFIIIGLALIIVFSVFNKNIIENLETNDHLKLELTLIIDQGSVTATNFMTIWSKIRENYKEDARVLLDEKPCINMEDYLKTCTGGKYPYNSVLKNYVEEWKKACPWIGISILDKSGGETLDKGATRALVGIGGTEQDKSTIKVEELISTIDRLIVEYNVTITGKSEIKPNAESKPVSKPEPIEKPKQTLMQQLMPMTTTTTTTTTTAPIKNE